METLTPELHTYIQHADPSGHEALGAFVEKLKQRTVNSLNPTPSQLPHTPSQLPFPQSDDPGSNTGGVSASCHDPKPSSPTTGPAPQACRTHHQKAKHLINAATSVLSTVAAFPEVAVEKLPSLGTIPAPLTITTSHRSRIPSPFPQEDCLSSSDEEFCSNYRALLRRKSDKEMATQQPRVPVVEQPKKQRNIRKSNSSRVQKRKPRKSQREIPFSDPEYHKMVGPMVLPESEIARDLATMYGSENKETMTKETVPALRPSARKSRERSQNTNR